MKTSIFSARNRAVAGPGGWFCTCCGPSPKHRKMTSRLHKKRTYRMLNKIENIEQQPST